MTADSIAEEHDAVVAARDEAEREAERCHVEDVGQSASDETDSER